MRGGWEQGWGGVGSTMHTDTRCHPGSHLPDAPWATPRLETGAKRRELMNASLYRTKSAMLKSKWVQVMAPFSPLVVWTETGQE